MKPKFLLALTLLALVISSATGVQLFRHIKKAFSGHKGEKEEETQKTVEKQKVEEPRDEIDDRRTKGRRDDYDDRRDSKRSTRRPRDEYEEDDYDDRRSRTRRSNRRDDEEEEGGFKGGIKKAVMGQLFGGSSSSSRDDDRGSRGSSSSGGSLKERIVNKVIDKALERAAGSYFT